jgi:hypothetical protein
MTDANIRQVAARLTFDEAAGVVSGAPYGILPTGRRGDTSPPPGDRLRIPSTSTPARLDPGGASDPHLLLVDPADNFDHWTVAGGPTSRPAAMS